MNDSWMPLKLEAGLDAMYSNPSVLITSTMKSEPGLSTRKTCSSGGKGSVSAAWIILAVSAGVIGGDTVAPCPGSNGSALEGEACPLVGRTIVAAPAAAPATAPLRNPRRPTCLSVVAMPVSQFRMRSEEQVQIVFIA